MNLDEEKFSSEFNVKKQQLWVKFWLSQIVPVFLNSVVHFKQLQAYISYLKLQVTFAKELAC